MRTIYESSALMADGLSSDTSIQLIICGTLHKLSNECDLTLLICKVGITKPASEASQIK